MRVRIRQLRVHHLARSAKEQRGNRGECRDGLPEGREMREKDGTSKSGHLLLVVLSSSLFRFSLSFHPFIPLFFSLFSPSSLPFFFFLAMHRNSLKVVLKRGDDTTTACLKDKWYFFVMFCDYTLFSRLRIKFNLSILLRIKLIESHDKNMKLNAQYITTNTFSILTRHI